MAATQGPITRVADRTARRNMCVDLATYDAATQKYSCDICKAAGKTKLYSVSAAHQWKNLADHLSAEHQDEAEAWLSASTLQSDQQPKITKFAAERPWTCYEDMRIVDGEARRGPSCRHRWQLSS